MRFICYFGLYLFLHLCILWSHELSKLLTDNLQHSNATLFNQSFPNQVRVLLCFFAFVFVFFLHRLEVVFFILIWIRFSHQNYTIMITIAFITIFVYYKLAFQYFLLSFSIAKDNAGQKKSRITLIFLDIKVWSEFRQIQTKTKGTFANRKYICRRLRANIFIFQIALSQWIAPLLRKTVLWLFLGEKNVDFLNQALPVLCKSILELGSLKCEYNFSG